MVAASFSHVRVWVFDLDHTLYPPDSALFAQIEVKMTQYICDHLGMEPDAANELRRKYWKIYGTTLNGLMREHFIDPDPFLEQVHQIDFSHLQAAPDLATNIAALPGRKIVYTNGTRPYAHQALKARGLSDVFDAVYGVEHAGYRPKPDQAAFEAVFALDGVAPEKGAFFEDDVRNLSVPHALGMRTVLVGPNPDPAPHIHHHTDDLTDFLSQVV